MRENSDLQLTNRVIPNHNRLTSCNTCTRSAEDVGGQGKPALRVLARWAC